MRASSRSERRELVGRGEHQRGSVAGATRVERDLRAQDVSPSALELVQRPRLCRAQQRSGRIGRSSMALGLRRGQQARRLRRRIQCERGRPLQERRRGSHAAARLGPIGRSLELVRDLGVRP